MKVVKIKIPTRFFSCCNGRKMVFIAKKLFLALELQNSII